MRSIKVHYQGDIYRFSLGIQNADDEECDMGYDTYFEYLQREIYDNLAYVNNDFTNNDIFKYVDEDGDLIVVRSMQDMHDNHLEIWNTIPLVKIVIYI